MGEFIGLEIKKHDELTVSRNRAKKLNNYEITDNIVTMYTTNTNQSFIIDITDFERIKESTWYETAHGYIKTKCHSESEKCIFLHRLIMNVNNLKWKTTIVDHINGNPLDNRKSNLRMVTPSENGMNMKIPSHNTSGYKGVTFSKECNKWEAQIQYNNKRINLGRFKDIQDAIKAREKAEIFYFKEYSYLNR